MKKSYLLLFCSLIMMSGCARQVETPLDPGPWNFVLSPETTETQVCSKLADEKTAHWLPLKAHNKANTASNYLDRNSFQFQQQQGRVIYRTKGVANNIGFSLYILKMADCKRGMVKQGALYSYSLHSGKKKWSTCEKLKEDTTFVWVTPKEVPSYTEILDQICKPSAEKASL